MLVITDVLVTVAGGVELVVTVTVVAIAFELELSESTGTEVGGVLGRTTS